MSECGLTNLATCLPEYFFEYIVTLLNAPVEPLLTLIKALLTEPVNINLFQSFWALIIYIISLFYGLFFIFAGFNFLISGYNASKRENAKAWIRNVVLMVLFVQSSFFIYDLIIETGALLTAGVVEIIDPEFFLLTADSFASVGMQLSFIIPYLTVLILTAILLGLRYLLVAAGVAFFPIAIFFYFIPPLQSYGKMIINFLMVIIFITFFDSIILLCASALIDIAIYENLKILVATSAFAAIDILMIIPVIFVLVKAALSVLSFGVKALLLKGVARGLTSGGN